MADFTTAVRKLEFDKIIQRIASCASTDPGRSLAGTIAPLDDEQWISEELQRVDEAKRLLIAEGHLPLEGLKDVRPQIRKTAVEQLTLSPQELLDVAIALRVSRTIRAFLTKRKQDAPLLAQIATGLATDTIVEFNITEAIDEAARIRDSASKELHSIRRESIHLQDHLRKRLSSILRKVAEQELTQEDIVTTRDGRLVIPVKSEFKHRVAGFIHSTSSSGATVFIEPAETLDLNNALRELQFREQREIDRILKELTSQVAAIRDPLLATIDALARIDLIAAKGRYSIQILGGVPRLAKERLLLRDAFHPLLLQTHERSAVVPLSLEMGESVHTILITGPNAGGKSVALKTAGLAILMAHAGIHIPASPDSEIPLIDGMFVDMGDDQSIENDLSTFSSHLLNLRTILQKAGRTSVVLLDEIGAGTDPAEGGALAAVILKRLNDAGALTLATTHHGSLKVFAHETAGMANASMEFDRRTLTPTYRFRYGVPGSSYALELAERMEFEPDVLADARRTLGERRNSLESLILSLEDEIQKQSRLRLTAEEEQRSLAALRKSYETKISAVRDEIKHMRGRAREELRELVEKAQSTIEQTVRSIREASASKASITAARNSVHEILRQAPAIDDNNAGRPELRRGDAVRLRGTSEVGELTGITGDTATVLWKNGTMKVQVRDLEAAQGHAPEGVTTVSLPEAHRELDVRGLSGDEAILKVQNFLDDAWIAGLRRADIIHGKGTGTLRKRITEVLKGHQHVRNYRLGEWNEGGAGVTVVELSDDEA